MKLMAYFVVQIEFNQSSLGPPSSPYLPLSYFQMLVFIDSQNGCGAGSLSREICPSLSPLESFQ